MNKNWQHHGLTTEQVRDCYKANRSPYTGKRFRTSPPSQLEHQARVTNWHKLMVKGAFRNLDLVRSKLWLDRDATFTLAKKLRDLETQILNQLAADYALFRAEELAKSESNKP